MLESFRRILSDDAAIERAESFDALLKDIKAGNVTLWQPFESYDYTEVTQFMQEMVDTLSNTFPKGR